MDVKIRTVDLVEALIAICYIGTCAPTIISINADFAIVGNVNELQLAKLEELGFIQN